MIRINKPGYLYILLTIFIGFSAVNTANNLLYIVTSTLLSYMLVSGIFGRRNLRGLDVVLEFPEERFAGTPVPVGVRLINRRRFMPAFLTRVMIGAEEVLFPIVNPGTSSLLHFDMIFDRRGRHTLSGITLSSIFPFNFFTRYRRVPHNLDLIVFPGLRPCTLQSLLADRTRWRGEAPSDQPGTDSDLLSIRDYVFGDALKYISWKATAKTGQLKTKELATPESPNILIDFNRLREPNVELALSGTAFLIVRAIHAGTPVGLIIDGESYQPSATLPHKTMLLTRLALHGQN